MFLTAIPMPVISFLALCQSCLFIWFQSQSNAGYNGSSSHCGIKRRTSNLSQLHLPTLLLLRTINKIHFEHWKQTTHPFRLQKNGCLKFIEKETTRFHLYYKLAEAIIPCNVALLLTILYGKVTNATHHHRVREIPQLVHYAADMNFYILAT